MKAVKSLRDAKNYAQKNLTEERWKHTEGVLKLAESVSREYDVAGTELQLTAVYHDVARDRDETEQRQLAERFLGELDPVEKGNPGLWHAPAGAQLLVEERRFKNENPIVQTVAYHTTGRPEPSALLMGLLICDFAEPNRSYPEADDIRSRIGSESISILCRNVVKHKIQSVLDNNALIHPRSIKTYNSLCD